MAETLAWMVREPKPSLFHRRFLSRSTIRAVGRLEEPFSLLVLHKQVFRALDIACPPHTIVASTTSALLPSATRRPDRVLVAHYFNRPTLVPLVELVRGPQTSDDTICTVRDVLLHIAKRPATQTGAKVAGSL